MNKQNGTKVINRWATYIHERFSLPTFSMLSAGICLSGMYLTGGKFQLIPFLMSFTGIMLFLALFRLIDDLQDFDKDSIAYPMRPLPRGLIKQQEVNFVIRAFQIGLLIYMLLIWLILQREAAFAYLLLLLYTWLVNKKFYIGKRLNRHLLLWDIMKQSCIFPAVIFVVSVGQPHSILSSTTWTFGLMLFGSFFCYALCRTMDPGLHPILGTCVHYYGFRRAFEIAAIALILSAMGASLLGLGILLWPLEIFVLVALTLPFFRMERFFIAAFAARISLLVHVWAVVINRFFILDFF